MDNKNNPMDDWLREAERSAEFPYEESNWLRMAKRLDDEMPEKKRRLVIFSWPSWVFLLLGAVIIGMASYVVRHEKQVKLIRQNQSAIKNETSQSTQAISSARGGSMETANTEMSYTSSTTLPSNQDDKTISKEAKQIRKKSSTSSRVSDAPLNTPRTADEKGANSSLFKGQKKRHVPTPNEVVYQETPSSYKRKNSKELSTNREGEDRLTNKLLMENNKPIQWVQGKPMQALDTQIHFQPQRMSDEEMIRYNPRYVHHLSQYEATRMDSITIIRYHPLQEDKGYVSSFQQPDTFLNTYRLHFLVGSMLWRGFIGGNTWSPAPYLSLGINKPLSTQLTLSAQVGFTYFAGLQTQNRTVSYRYKFGIDSTVYTALHKMVFRIQWPIQLTWSVNKNHGFMVGVGAAWQPDGISRVTAPAQVLSGGTAPNYNTPMQTKNQLGYLNGIKLWDGFVQLAYQYQWHERMALQVLWQAGMRDMTDNQILSSNRIQRNHGLMIGLRYGFVRNKH